MATLLLAVFVALAWGALRDGASADPVRKDKPAAVAVETPSDHAQVGRGNSQADHPSTRRSDVVRNDTTTTEATTATRTDRLSQAARSQLNRLAALQTREQTTVEPSAVQPEAVAAPAADAPVTAAASLAPTVSQCNPSDGYPTGAGQGVTCKVRVENTIGPNGETSSKVTTTECLSTGAVVAATDCKAPVVVKSGQLVTSVDQCNGILAGGSNLTCSVEVISNVPVGTTPTGVTSNQCNGSGAEGPAPTTKCDPTPATTTNATVDQCNGSANGGGAANRVQCTVSGADSATPVTVDQCNGSTAAGSTVTCDVTYTNNYVPVDAGGGGGGGGGNGGGGNGGGNGGGGTGGTGGGGTGGNGGGGGGTPPGAGGSSSGQQTPSAAVLTGVSSRPVILELARTTRPAPTVARSTKAATATRMPAAAGTGTTAGLAATGAATQAMSLIALAIMAIGGLLVLAARRPRNQRA